MAAGETVYGIDISSSLATAPPIDLTRSVNYQLPKASMALTCSCRYVAVATRFGERCARHRMLTTRLLTIGGAVRSVALARKWRGRSRGIPRNASGLRGGEWFVLLQRSQRLKIAVPYFAQHSEAKLPDHVKKLNEWVARGSAKGVRRFQSRVDVSHQPHS